MDLENTILDEIGQSEKDKYLRFHSYVEFNEQTEVTSKTETDSKESRQTVLEGVRGGGRDCKKREREL